MSESIVSLVTEAKKSKYSLVTHLSEDDVLAIWDGLADFIEKQMLQIKGVCLHGFGTFTFSRRKIDIGGGKVLMIQRPVFVMCENFIQTHSLSYPKQMATNQIPVVSLNYTVLSNGTPYNRDTVELSLREILQALGKALAACKNVNVDFPKIGRLMIREKRGHMKFYKEFLRSIDSSGKIEYAFNPSSSPQGCEGSIISDPNHTPIHRPKILPKIVETPEDDSTCTSNSTSDNSSSGSIFPKTQAVKDYTPIEGRPGTPFHTVRPATVLPHSYAPSTVSNQSTKTDSTSSDSQASSCSHSSNDESSLCYICHQRELRNIPVYLAEERKRKEKLHDKLLQEFQLRKAELIIAQEKARHLQNWEIAKEAAQFNFNAMERRKLIEAKNSVRYSDYHPSCIFQNRPLTPCYTKKQLKYCRQLDEQVKRRRDAKHAMKQQDSKLERQEQLQLSKELDLIKEAYAVKMREQKASYLQALDDQVKLKDSLHQRSPSPVAQPVFAVQHTSPVKKADYQKREKQLFREQLALVAEKQQALKVKALKEKDDAHQLEQNLQDLKKDLQKSRQERSHARKELEEYWQETLRRKQTNPQVKELPHSFLLHDQCKKYLRCHQCQRKVDNIGKSNILSESRYLAGARLIV